jgi:hypothetical protein
MTCSGATAKPFENRSSRGDVGVVRSHLAAWRRLHGVRTGASRWWANAIPKVIAASTTLVNCQNFNDLPSISVVPTFAAILGCLELRYRSGEDRRSK